MFGGKIFKKRYYFRYIIKNAHGFYYFSSQYCIYLNLFAEAMFSNFTRPSNVGVYDIPYVIRNFKIDYNKWKEFILLGRNEK